MDIDENVFSKDLDVTIENTKKKIKKNEIKSSKKDGSHLIKNKTSQKRTLYFKNREVVIRSGNIAKISDDEFNSKYFQYRKHYFTEVDK